MSRLAAKWNASVGGLPRTYWLLWTGTLINRLGMFVMPFLTLYLTEERGLTAAQAGNVVASFGVGSLLANPIGGVLTDRWGRKPTMVASLVLGAGALLMLSTVTGFARLTVATFAFGLFSEAYRPASAAMIADVVPPADRLRAFSHLYWAVNLGSGVAPIVAGLLAKNHFQLLFIADAATTVACAVLIAITISETRPQNAQAVPFTFQGMSAPFSDGPFLGFLLSALLSAIILFQFLVAIPVDMKAHGLSNLDYSLAMSVNGFLIVGLQPFVTELISRRRRARVLALSALLLGGGYGLNAFAGSTVLLWAVAVVVWTLGEILMAPMNSSIAADLSPAHQRGQYQGAASMSFSFAWILAPTLGGAIITQFGTRTLWISCFALGILVALLHLALAPARRRRMQALHGAGASAD